MMDSTPIVKLEQVARVYGTEQNPLTVLRDVNLEVADGEYVAIVGPSGAGKSTMLNILGCLDRPTRGAYLFMGRNVAELDDEALSRVRKHHLGFVF
ncbi:MAG: ATP-binding cassette domain-containing protein, partial [Phycisphaerae bacterium]|nr:ATP-binding cassette domain-containing protein [Phycisphaerae bacterium]